MSSGWEEYSLLDAFDVRNGLTKKREEFGFGAPFVAFKDVFNNHFIPEELDSLANTTPKEQKKYSIKRGDVLITRTSENFEELGMTSVALKDYPAAAYNGFTKRLRPKKGIVLKPEYLGFFFRSPFFRRQVLSLTTMTTRASLNNEMLARLKIKVPPAKEQDRIAEVLLSCHKKIHLNQQTNETLEAMAQTIFKSWFVDFDPVRAKIEAKPAGRDPNRAAMATIAGIPLEQDWDEVESALDQKLARMTEEQRQQLTRTAELFPDKLVESEIGEVPKGWEAKTAEEILKRYRAPKRVKKDEVEETGNVVVLEQGEGIIMGYHNGEAGYDASPDNPYFIFGDHTCITHLVIEPFDIAPNVIPLQGKEFDSYWTYYAIRDLQQFQEYRRHWSELKVKEVVTPNNGLDEQFADLIKPLIMKINKNRDENLTLSQLRDTLLPKLISGEIQIDN